MWGFLLDSCDNDNIVCDMFLISFACHRSIDSN
jgi:hypothetical protein